MLFRTHIDAYEGSFAIHSKKVAIIIHIPLLTNINDRIYLMEGIYI